MPANLLKISLTTILLCSSLCEGAAWRHKRATTSSEYYSPTQYYTSSSGLPSSTDHGSPTQSGTASQKTSSSSSLASSSTATVSSSVSSSSSPSSSSCPAIWSTIAADLKSSFSGCSNIARNAIRFAFHDSAGYSVKNPTYAPASGGADGSLLLNDEEVSRGDNGPMKQIYRDGFLLGKYNTYKNNGVGAADLVQFAGSLGIKSCTGGPTVKTVVGRSDSSTACPDGGLPQAFGIGSDYDTLIQLWADKTFSPRELAALMGAHTVSIALTERSNGIQPGGSQDSDPTVWNNHYFSQTQSGGTPGVYSFASDVNLSNASTECGAAFTEYGANSDLWLSEFAAAMAKLSVLGIPQSTVDGFVDCTSLIS